MLLNLGVATQAHRVRPSSLGSPLRTKTRTRRYRATVRFCDVSRETDRGERPKPMSETPPHVQNRCGQVGG